jgi:hypothetical protein
MANKIKEQIDYGNRPERMDPNLERKLASPESLYAQNPAMKKKEADVQRLVSNRFQKVAEKLSEVMGRDISSKQVQGQIFQEMMRRLPGVMSIESRHKEELEQLAIDAALDASEVPVDWYEIEAILGQGINTSDFRINPDDEDEEEDEEESNEIEIPSFDIEDLTKEEIFELEKHKRNIINALIQGASKKGHYIFQKPEIKERLDAIDPRLYRDYLTIMAANDFMYFTMEDMIEMMSQTGQGVAGKVKLKDNDEEGGGEEEGEEKPDTVIVAQGLIFPILCHEIIKGLEEAKGRHGLPKDPEMAQKVMGQTDTLANEPEQLRIGPEIVERIRMVLPDKIYEPENRGLINWFHIVLYQIEPQEFLEIIGNAISEDSSKVAKATSKFNEIMREAMQMKDEFENYKEEEGIDSDEDDDDDLDDFLGSLGISRPK